MSRGLDTVAATVNDANRRRITKQETEDTPLYPSSARSVMQENLVIFRDCNFTGASNGSFSETN